MKKIVLFVFVVIVTILVNIPLLANDGISQITSSDLQRLNSKIEQLEKRVQTLEKQVSKQAEPDFPEIPCMDEGFDTETTFNELGIGEGVTPEEAKQEAIQKAIESLAIKIFPEMISYEASVSNTKKDYKIINNITKEQKQFIANEYNITCVKYNKKTTGMYEVFVAISILKSKIKNYKQQ